MDTLELLVAQFATKNARYNRKHWSEVKKCHAEAKAKTAQLQVLQMMPHTASFRDLLPGANIKKARLVIEYESDHLGTCSVEWQPTSPQIPKNLSKASTSRCTALANAQKRKLEAVE